MDQILETQPIEGTPGQLNHAAGVIESLLFVNEKPVTLDQMKKVLETVGAADIRSAIDQLRREYDARQAGVMIVEIAGGYQMLSNPLYASYLRSFYKTKQKEKLSKPSLESLAIIAYKQPVTRADVELIRGVNSDGVVTHLLEKELIKVVGRKDVPGRPFLYGTTKQFLEYFGLKSIEDLPTLEEFPALLQPAAETDLSKQGVLFGSMEQEGLSPAAPDHGARPDQAVAEPPQEPAGDSEQHLRAEDTVGAAPSSTSDQETGEGQ